MSVYLRSATTRFAGIRLRRRGPHQVPSTGILPNAGLPRGFFAANPQKESLDWQYRCFSRPSLNQSRGPPTYDRSEPRDAKYPIAFGAYIGFLLGALLDDVHKRYLKARLEQASKRLSYWESVLPDDDVLETMYHWSDDPAVTAADAVTPSYRPLLYKKDIRILVLLPARSRDDDIHVHIGHMSLESKAIEFEALSYTWGDPNPRDLIYVSGKPVYVRRNLANALRSLRSHTQLHLLWVDDLCIDQSDTAERSQQVRLMGDVFSKADNVIIWLGNESDDSGTAFNALNKLYFNYYKKSRISKSPLSEKIATGSIPTVDVLESLPPKSALTDREWEALKNLLHRPWFHRLWVYQEAANAKSAVFKCGGAEIPWDNLSKALAYLSHYDLASAFLDAHSAFACTHVAAMERARSRPAPEPLFHAVLTSSYGACSDPRDKIFAVMSIADGKDVFDWEVSFDYSLPVFDLFRRFAIWDIVRCGSLRSLSCASAPLPDGLSSLQLPSWAPDWTHFNNPNILARFKNTSGFAAAGSNEMDVWFTHNKTVLHAKGIIVDSIQSLSSSPAPIKSTALFDISEKTIDGLTNAYEWLLECWDLAAASKAMTPARYDTFWRTMLCGLTADGRPAPRSYAGYFIKYLQFLRITPGELNSLLYTDWHDSPSDDWLIPEREQRFQVYFNGQYTSTARIEDALKVWTPHRRFCITTEGRLALVPDHAAPGDTIAVLFGSEVPYCLRLQEDGTYTVIGECYLHGMMHGEALQLPASEHGPAIIRMR